LKIESAKRPGVIARSEATRQSSCARQRAIKKQLSLPQTPHLLFSARLPACNWIASLRSQ
jgi:hypothetical protein